MSEANNIPRRFQDRNATSAEKNWTVTINGVIDVDATGDASFHSATALDKQTSGWERKPGPGGNASPIL